MNLSFKKWGIIVTNLATAFLHLSLFPQMGPDPIALNGLGYLGLLGADVVDDDRRPRLRQGTPDGQADTLTAPRHQGPSALEVDREGHADTE